jgi:hypothetical protein
VNPFLLSSQFMVNVPTETKYVAENSFVNMFHSR